MSAQDDAAMEVRGEGVADPLPGGLIVVHWRIDPGRRVLRALGLGGLAIALGAMLVAAALSLSRPAEGPLAPGASQRLLRRTYLAGAPVDADGNPLPRRPVRPEEVALGLAGLASILLGGAIVIVGLRKELRSDAYLALRTDGALFRDGARADGVRWEDVEAVRWDAADRAVQFVLHDGRAWARRERFAGIEGEELARRAGEVRRKALFGLYR